MAKSKLLVKQITRCPLNYSDIQRQEACSNSKPDGMPRISSACRYPLAHLQDALGSEGLVDIVELQQDLALRFGRAA